MKSILLCVCETGFECAPSRLPRRSRRARWNSSRSWTRTTWHICCPTATTRSSSCSTPPHPQPAVDKCRWHATVSRAARCPRPRAPTSAWASECASAPTASAPKSPGNRLRRPSGTGCQPATVCASSNSEHRRRRPNNARGNSCLPRTRTRTRPIKYVFPNVHTRRTHAQLDSERSRACHVPPESCLCTHRCLVFAGVRLTRLRKCAHVFIHVHVLWSLRFTSGHLAPAFFHSSLILTECERSFRHLPSTRDIRRDPRVSVHSISRFTQTHCLDLRVEWPAKTWESSGYSSRVSTTIVLWLLWSTYRPQ